MSDRRGGSCSRQSNRGLVGYRRMARLARRKRVVPLSMERSAHFSRCKRYRYALWRTWDARLPTMLFVGLNPSKADAIRDDPTIRRCIRFAQDRGYGRLVVANLFARRTPKPVVLRKKSKPIGRQNNHWLLRLAAESDVCVAAWGNNGKHLGRDVEVVALIKDLKCLGLTKAGAPRHPLYVRADTKLRPLAD